MSIWSSRREGGDGATLTLVIPGLLGPVNRQQLTTMGSLSALQRLLATARRGNEEGHHGGYQQLLAELFDYPVQHGGAGLPVAALSRFADALPPNPFTLRADPVHLHPDQSRLYLMASAELALQEAESRRIVTSLNDHFSDRGWRFDFSHPQRWYLSADELPALHGQASELLLGRSVERYLPHGPNALQWRALINEIEMLLFDHPVNVEREGRGELTVNGLWLWGWGEGVAPLKPSWQSVWSESPLTRGLAKASGCEPSEHPPNGIPDTFEGRGLMDIDTLMPLIHGGRVNQWCSAVELIDKGVLAPLLGQLAEGRLDSIKLYPLDGHSYTLDRKRLRRWWRPRRPIGHYLHYGSVEDV